MASVAKRLQRTAQSLFQKDLCILLPSIDTLINAPIHGSPTLNTPIVDTTNVEPHSTPDDPENLPTDRTVLRAIIAAHEQSANEPTLRSSYQQLLIEIAEMLNSVSNIVETTKRYVIILKLSKMLTQSSF